ncbi:MAG TPA: ABC transporter ATP-binding protein/permease [Microvirga sp.]|jgi:ABC-type multidrug transport system fused ATPase/permease subunit|nr:ABC transporter ATP-binding protein/permease [Microvirga sp.]
MERDPLRLVWRTTPGHHLVAFVLLGLCGALVLAGIDLVRLVVDGIAGAGAPAPLLRLAIPLPERVSETPVVLFPGIPLDRTSHQQAVLLGLAAVPVLLGGVLALLQMLAAQSGARVVARLRTGILDRVLAARASTRDEAEAAAQLAGDALSREGLFLGSALIGVLQWAGLVLAALLYIVTVDGRLAVAAGALLVCGAALGLHRLTLRWRTSLAARLEGAAVADALFDLLRRLPALRAHGTGAFERGRLHQDWRLRHRAVARMERRLAMTGSVSGALLLLTPLAVLGCGVWLGAGRATPGALVAAAAAAALAALAVREITRWQRALDQAHGWLTELAQTLAPLAPNENLDRPVAVPRAGALVARGVSAYDPATGARIGGVDCTIAFPAHVALVGDDDDSPRVLAALIAGQLEPSMGQLTYGGVDLAAADPVERARRIAYAGGTTILVPGSFRDNLLYGCPDHPERDARLSEAIAVAGLDGLVHARGLAGTLDPRREERLAAAIVESRRTVRAMLAAQDLDRFVDPFDAARYNRHATIGENLLFGQPIGDTFREDNLASHPFVRAILEAVDLTKPLTAMGLSIASTMIEMFADIPAGHPLFERFSFFSAAERGYFEDLVERRSGRRRSDSARDREHLIGLALRYDENRHRLGLLDETLQARIVAARADFARMLPASLKPAIEFFDPDRLCTAASVQDNLLFGRVAGDRAGAEEAVHRVIRRVLTERGLDGEVSRIGLDGPIDPHGGDLSAAEIAAIDLVRCLVRDPDIVVVDHALDGLTAAQAEAVAARLRRFLVGRGLVLCASALTPGLETPPFDRVLRFRRGALLEEEAVAPVPEAVPA